MSLHPPISFLRSRCCINRGILIPHHSIESMCPLQHGEQHTLPRHNNLHIAVLLRSWFKLSGVDLSTARLSPTVAVINAGGMCTQKSLRRFFSKSTPELALLYVQYRFEKPSRKTGFWFEIPLPYQWLSLSDGLLLRLTNFEFGKHRS